MANIPLKWGIIGTDGKVEINGADDSVFSSSSPAFKVNGDGTVTGNFSVSGNESLSGNLIMPPTATISVVGTKNTGKVISFIDNTADTAGLGISIGGGGPTIIGGGESADVLKAQVGTSGAEEMYIGNDSSVNIFSNLQTGWAARKSWTFGTDGTLTMQPGIGTSYIQGCGGTQSGIYVKKDALNQNHWIPGVTIQTKAGGGWSIGNYDNEDLEFAYGTKANIDANNNVVSHVYLRMDGTNQQRWICSTANGPGNNTIAVGDGTTGGIKSSGYGITTSVSSTATASLVTSAGVYNAVAAKQNKITKSSTSRNFTSKTTMSYTGLSLTCPANHIYLVQAWFRYSHGAPRYVAACHSNTTYAFYDCVAASTDTGTTNAGHSSLSFILTPGETIYYWAMYYNATANFISETIIDIAL